ncbi:glycogen debranching protein [Algoriphagus terrigena]|uniref:glycogen debranching protein n=1 Tax=Algoriphagus terrigena TaxID=344884 RepID=UPI00040597C4|nr:isoamylase [Algoriphagus terrigena]
MDSTQPGHSFPIGSFYSREGVNFSLFSKHATGVELLFFDSREDQEPASVISLDPRVNRTYHYWHVFVPGIQPGQLYGYRVLGPHDPAQGLRFDPEKILLDPYARSVVFSDSCPKSVVVDPDAYDWEGDLPLARPFSQTIIYEMHVAGFTKNPNSGVSEAVRGTYAGMIEKIPYLLELGITAVELMPVFQFDPKTSDGRINYWGYNPVSFFSVHEGFSSKKDPIAAMDEFRNLVKALHKAGIEVILDVVYNHTAEGGEDGPTYSFRGIDNLMYYSLEADKAKYSNYSGCGNSLNANNPIVRRMILDSLRFWVKHMHVDGFRFDLASILSRDGKGRLIENPPILWDIESDPVLAGTKLIAEAWDAAGLYQVGTFVGDSWKEWNGRFRDDVRSFIKGDNGKIKSFISRMIGSPDIFGHQEREPEQSINFVTCHDGFTLYDLVAYEHKHNELNGEGNRDGANDNLSWNCGVEGPSSDPGTEFLREKQMRNFFATVLLAVGTPMLFMGDEVKRTQLGNNNPYCQDNELSWFDWDLVAKNQGLFRFVKIMTAQRLKRDASQVENSMSLKELLDKGQITYHGVKLNATDWSDQSHAIAFSVESLSQKTSMHIMINAYFGTLEFEVPQISQSGKTWRVWVDTGKAAPADIYEWGSGPEFAESHVSVEGRSIVIFVS